MKKIIALLLACMMLFLTACNQTPPSETTGGLPNETTGSQSSGTPEKPGDSLPQGIIRNGFANMMETPSRILFSQKRTIGSTFYYSKADGKAYIYCFDPLCSHEGGCLASPQDDSNIFSFELRCTFFINNRFYSVTGYGQIYSFAFDGSDLRIEYGEDEYVFGQIDHNLWSQNYRAYGKYIYIPMDADENGKPCTLRFNTETKEMENLTEKTGNYIAPVFFYNGEIYGRGADRLWHKTDLELKEMQSIDTMPTSTVFYENLFFETVFNGAEDYSKERAIGLEVYDVKTGEKTLISNEMMGLEAPKGYTVVAADENYVYFYPYEQVLFGTTIDAKGKEVNVYKNNPGKLYRVKHDGTECVCVYDDPGLAFNGSDAVLTGDQILIWGQSFYFDDNGYAKKTSITLKAGTISPDGTIEKFEDVELIY